jgi:hypothetical protein
MTIAELFKRRLNPVLLRRVGVAPAPRTRFLMGQRMSLFEGLGIETVLDVDANVGQCGTGLRGVRILLSGQSRTPPSPVVRAEYRTDRACGVAEGSRASTCGDHDGTIPEGVGRYGRCLPTRVMDR